MRVCRRSSADPGWQPLKFESLVQSPVHHSPIPSGPMNSKTRSDEPTARPVFGSVPPTLRARHGDFHTGGSRSIPSTTQSQRRTRKIRRGRRAHSPESRLRNRRQNRFSRTRAPAGHPPPAARPAQSSPANRAEPDRATRGSTGSFRPQFASPCADRGSVRTRQPRRSRRRSGLRCRPPPGGSQPRSDPGEQFQGSPSIGEQGHDGGQAHHGSLHPRARVDGNAPGSSRAGTRPGDRIIHRAAPRPSAPRIDGPP